MLSATNAPQKRRYIFRPDANGVYRNAFRAKRLQLFMALVDRVLLEKSTCRVLDLGGEQSYWTGLDDIWAGRNLQITIVNLNGRNATEGCFTSVSGDARNMAEYIDYSFDLVHSNSVLEHVGDWSDKMRMANEVRRLAPHYFVQTPNFWFPFEPHMRVPMIHWLPRHVQRRIVMSRSCGFYERAVSIGRAHEILADAEMLDLQEMRDLFPDASIRKEKLGPLTKSLIAIR